MHYYTHNIGDYRRDTSHLSLLEHGVYRQLLDLYYLEEKPIPKETQWVMRRLSARTQEEQNAVVSVLNDFFFECEDGWRHNRCDAEVAKYLKNSDKNRENGKLGGRPKKTQSVSDGLANGNRNESENNPNQEPITKNQYKNLPANPDGFAAFWSAYPKKKSKGDAEKAWKRIKPDAELRERIDRSLEAMKASADWLKDGGQYIPYPATWLNAKGWEDEICSAVPAVVNSNFAGALR